MRTLLKLLFCFTLFTAADGVANYSRTVESVIYGAEELQMTLSDGSVWNYKGAKVDELQGIENREVLVRNAGCIGRRAKRELILILENGKGILDDYCVTMTDQTKKGLHQIMKIQEVEVNSADLLSKEYHIQLSDGSYWVVSNSKVYHFFSPPRKSIPNGFFSDLKISDSVFRKNLSTWKVGDYLLISSYCDGYYLSIIPAGDRISTLAVFVK